MGITITVPKKYGSVITVTINNQKYALRAGQTLSVPLEVKAVLDDMERLQPKEAEKLALYEELMQLDPDFRAENIVDGVEMFGLMGTGGNLSAHPTLKPQDTWFTGGTATAKSAVTEIRVVDWYVPKGTETSWSADVEDVGKIKCYLDGSVLIISGNGSGRIMANADSKKLFDEFSNVVSITGLSVLDTRYVTNLVQAFSRLDSLQTLEGCANWDVRNCSTYKNLFAHLYGSYNAFAADLSGWDVSLAVQAASSDATVFSGMFNNCLGMQLVAFHKSFDLSYIILPVPHIGNEEAQWLDTATNLTYTDTDDDKAVTVKDGLPNPHVAGRCITLEAVLPEGEVDV